MTEQADILIRVVSQPRYLAVIRAVVETAAAKMGLAEEVCGQVVLAVDEAMANVIRHGYKGLPDRPIWLKISPVSQDGHTGIQIIIEDECTGVDLDKIKGRRLEEVRPGGLGVHIITGVMDQVEYQSRPDGTGVRLKMVKFAAPPGTPGVPESPAPTKKG